MNKTIVLLVLCNVTLAFCVFMMFRNSWTYKNRIKIIEEDYADGCRKISQGWIFKPGESTLPRYSSMPSYDAMMWRFWVWDVNKFIGLRKN